MTAFAFTGGRLSEGVRELSSPGGALVKGHWLENYGGGSEVRGKDKAEPEAKVEAGTSAKSQTFWKSCKK